MVNCCVFGCYNKPKKNSEVRFFSFPKNEERRKAWVKAVRRKDWQPSYRSKVCSVHFEERFFDRSSLVYVRLRDNAVPSIFPSFPSYLQKVVKHRKPPADRNKQKKTVHPNPLPDNLQKSLDVATSEDLTDPMHVHPVPNNSELKTPDVSTTRDQTHSELTLTTESDTAPRKNMLKRKLNEVKTTLELASKKAKLLPQLSNQRLHKMNATFKNVFHDLHQKQLLEEDRIQLLEKTVTGPSIEILQRACSRKKKTTYAPQLRAFAMTLHYYSPRAYAYVQETFDTCLPHLRTIQTWYQTINGLPGFTTESLVFLNKTSEKAFARGHPLICSLLIGEMEIRQHVEFDGNRFFGQVDMGTGLMDDNLPPAIQVLAFMVVAINDSWRLPVGYFLIDSLTGKERANVVRTCISTLHKVGVTIEAFTFDGAMVNLTMCKELGCNLTDPENLKTNFSHPVTKKPISVFLDPCHMLKLVRNTLGDNKTLFDGHGNTIEWSFLCKLNQLQESEGLHLGNKLHSNHIQWYRQKMKVQLASQLFSESVADAIDTCRINKLQEFQGSEATIQFIRVMNRLFDIFNSCNSLQKGWKAPIRKQNLAAVGEFLKFSEMYLKELKATPETSILDSNRKTGFLGFLICIKSLRDMCNRLLSSVAPPLHYLPTHKVSQDHLELLFEIIRLNSDCNNNPTARQFSSAYKRVLLDNELYAVTTGNCTEQDLTSIPILAATSATAVINFSCQKNRMADEDTNLSSNQALKAETSYDDDMENLFGSPMLHAMCDHDSSLHHGIGPSFVSPIVQRAVTYIAGWVVKKLSIAIKCEECLNSVESVPSLSQITHCYLISIKNKGGLVCPSYDVCRICLQAELFFRKAVLLCDGKPPSGKHTLNRVTTAVMHHFVGSDVFENLTAHMLNQAPLDNHVIHLIRATAESYLKVRYHHFDRLYSSKLHRTLLRHELTREIIFRDQ